MAEAQKKHIVIIEDNHQLCDLIKSYFDLNFKISLYFDGESCISEIDKIANAEIVVIDYQLAHMSGIELFLALKPRLTRAKFVFMTGHLSPEMAEEGFHLGFDSMILKPFDFKIFEKNVLELIDKEPRPSGKPLAA